MNNIIERYRSIVDIHVMIIKEKNILLLQRKNTGYYDDYFSLIAGHLEPNETITNAAVREAKEEAGIIIDEKKLKIIHIMHRKEVDIRISFFLLCNNWIGDIVNKEEDKAKCIKWFDMNNLPENIIPYIKKSISNYINNIFYENYGW